MSTECKDAWPAAWAHNEPLFEAMIASGCQFKNSKGLAHFVTSNGEYQPFPAGYVTYGSSFNGSPNPYHASVMLGNGSWAQRSYPGHPQCLEWAIPYAEDQLRAMSN